MKFLKNFIARFVSSGHRKIIVVPVLLAAVLVAAFGNAFLMNALAREIPWQSTWQNLTASTLEIGQKVLGWPSSEESLSIELNEEEDNFLVANLEEEKNQRVFSSQSFSLIRQEKILEKKLFPKSLPDLRNNFPFADCRFDAATTTNQYVVMNEVAWMGSLASSGEKASEAAKREWIELKNTFSSPVNLSGWQIKDESGKFVIKIYGNVSLSSSSFIVLQKENNQLPHFLSNAFLYKGSMNNDGLRLGLFDNHCRLVHEIDARSGWPAGDNQTKQTMERASGGDWQTSLLPGGTPGKENSVHSLPPPVVATSSPTSTPPVLPPTPTSTPTSTPNPTPAPNPTSSDPVAYPKLLINEVQIASENSVSDEFVEIYNPNDIEVLLTNWFLQKRTASGSSYSTFAPKALFEGVKIAPRGYIVISNSAGIYTGMIKTSNSLASNNTLVIKNPDGEIVDKLGWGGVTDCEGACAPNPLPGESLARKSTGGGFIDTDENLNDFEIRSCPSPGVESSSCVPLPPPPDPNPTPTSTPPLDSTPTSTPSSTPPVATTPKIIIVEVQISGGDGKSSEDYIKLFNADTMTADLSGWRLRKRTQSGAESSIRVLPAGSSLAPGGYFLWANSASSFSETIGAQVSSTQTLVVNNSVGLQNANSETIDAIAWGEGHTNPFVEGGVFPTNPDESQILRRKVSGSSFEDSNSNNIDFELVTR